MDSNFYIADPTNKEAQRLAEYVEAEPLPVPNIGFNLAMAAICAAISVAYFTWPINDSWLTIGLGFFNGFTASLNLLTAGMRSWPSLQKRRSIRDAKQCLEEGSIIAVPEAIKAPFETAAQLPKAQDSRPFWEANFFEVKNLLPLVPLLDDGNISDDRKEEAHSIINQKAAAAAAKFTELEATAKDAKLFIGDAEADSLLAMYRKRESDTPD